MLCTLVILHRSACKAFLVAASTKAAAALELKTERRLLCAQKTFFVNNALQHHLVNGLRLKMYDI